MQPQYQDILNEVARHLTILGSANDAEDHHYLDDAKQMRIDASEALSSLLADNPILEDLLPTLRSELKSEMIFYTGWSTLVNEIKNILNISNNK